MKPILFNTPMTQAIDRKDKRMTRRLVKLDFQKVYGMACVEGKWRNWYGQTIQDLPDDLIEWYIKTYAKKPYEVGDVLYVRETWRCLEASYPPGKTIIEYRAGGTAKFGEVIALPTKKGEWKPSIHMPKEAARTFLLVNNVRLERLQDMTDEQAKAEGIRGFWLGMGESGYAVSENSKTFYDGPIGAFANLWNSTIRPKDIETYGWNANPWVWVIEFEHISKGKAYAIDRAESMTDDSKITTT